MIFLSVLDWDRVSPGRPSAGLPGRQAGLRGMVNQSLIHAMSRLAPLIVRQIALAPSPAFEANLSAAPPRWLGDLRLFLTGWAGGLIFFWTLLS